MPIHLTFGLGKDLLENLPPNIRADFSEDSSLAQGWAVVRRDALVEAEERRTVASKVVLLDVDDRLVVVLLIAAAAALGLVWDGVLA